MMLAKAVNFLLANEAMCDAMAAAGQGVVADMEGALERTWQTLNPYIQPLVVKASLSPSGRTGEEGDADRMPVANGGARFGW